MGAERVVQPTEVWQNGRLSDQPPESLSYSWRPFVTYHRQWWDMFVPLQSRNVCSGMEVCRVDWKEEVENNCEHGKGDGSKLLGHSQNHSHWFHVMWCDGNYSPLLGTLREQFHVGGLAFSPKLWCYCAIIRGCVLLTPPPVCKTSGMAAFSPSTIHSWLGFFKFPCLESKETSQRPEIYTCWLCQRQGQEVSWRSRHLFLPSGLEKSYCIPWYLKSMTTVWKNKGLVLKQLCPLLVSTYHY